MTGKESTYIAEAHANHMLAGDGPFTKKCHFWIEKHTACTKALLTHSCTAALEMSALLLNLEQGDEIIMPSYTFVSTANAFVLRGAVPVFVDVREDTLNIDELLIEAAITQRTRAIVVVHYAGVACEMDTIMHIAKRHQLKVVEDAAQGIMSTYKNKPLGSIGDLGAYSFHETKNVISGEGGCLLVNSKDYVTRAEIIREKGTDRNRFFKGEVDKYTWQEAGSSFLPGELIAAFLWAQLEQADFITQARLTNWYYYHEKLKSLDYQGKLRRPIIPEYCQHNAHMYYVLLSPAINRQIVLDTLKANNIYALFHYIPLHSSPAGKKYGRTNGDLSVTEQASENIIRLPLWMGITETEQDIVCDALSKILNCSN